MFAISFIIGSWLLFAALFVGVGMLARDMGCVASRGRSIFAPFWVGWACVLAYLQLWHIVAPIDARAYILPVILGTVGYYRCARRMRAAVRRVVRFLCAAPLVTALFVGGAVAWTADHALAPVGAYDAGLYQLASIRWDNSYPLVPGLGNLHGRLALNSSYYLYMAMLNVGPWAGKGINIATSLLLVALVVQMIVGLVHALGHRPAPDVVADPRPYFLALLLGPTIAFALEFGIAGATDDVPMFLVQVVLAAQILALLSRSRAAAGREAMADLREIVLIAAAGILVKVSFALLALPVVGVAVAVSLATHRGERGHSRRILLTLGGVALLTVLPWMARGIVLSGYPVYPSALLPAPVPWRVCAACARRESDVIIAWARLPTRDYQTALDGWGWLGPWYRRTYRAYVPPLAIVGAMFGSAVALARRGGHGLPSAWALLGPLAVGMIGWFATAPEPRFAGALFWIAAALASALTLHGAGRAARAAGLALVWAVALAYVPHTATALVTPVTPGSLHGFYPLPVARLRVFVTSSGLRMYTAAPSVLVWDAPLPSTPYPNRSLHLICPHDLRWGFTFARGTAVCPSMRVLRYR